MFDEHGVFYTRENPNDIFFHEVQYICFKNDFKRESTIWVHGRTIKDALYDLNKLCYFWTRGGYQYYIKPFARF